MFFLTTLSKVIVLNPKCIQCNIFDVSIKKLKRVVEGTFDLCHGIYVIIVKKIMKFKHNISKCGKIHIKLTYKALVFKPYVNEILDGIVESVTKLRIYVDIYSIMRVCISRYHIPENFKFDKISYNEPMFVSKEEFEDVQISKGDSIRFKILNFRKDLKENIFLSMATIKQDYLGPC